MELEFFTVSDTISHEPFQNDDDDNKFYFLHT